ncbi:hypothetical protein HYS97_02885 [Candidatus Daviesbacteria bacterium]|nr:hypothetical protein [Candidatus Daviesbacteria bacterium]
MAKILIIVFAVILLSTGSAFFFYFRSNQAPKLPVVDLLSQVPVTSLPPPATPSASAASGLVSPAKSGIVAQNTSRGAEEKVNLLETKLSVLQKRIEALEARTPSTTTQTTTTTSSSTAKPPLYIPLGSGGSFTDRVYANFGGYIVNIDPGNYSGYTSMQLEVSMRLNQPGEKVKARLFNSTEALAISTSEVSTTSASYILLTSGNFTLPSGSKTYQLQVMSTDGVETFVQTARIKVNY